MTTNTDKALLERWKDRNRFYGTEWDNVRLAIKQLNDKYGRLISLLEQPTEEIMKAMWECISDEYNTWDTLCQEEKDNMARGFRAIASKIKEG